MKNVHGLFDYRTPPAQLVSVPRVVELAYGFRPV